MAAMIQNDEEKEWMLPLLELRNELDVADDRHLRDFRRMNGSVQLFHDEPIPGPYTQESREDWLTRAPRGPDVDPRRTVPTTSRSLELITLAELEEIRRIWVVEKHEFEDTLPGSTRRRPASPTRAGRSTSTCRLGADDDRRRCGRSCGEDRLHFELVRELLDVEQRHRARCAGRAVRVAREGASPGLLRRRGGRNRASPEAQERRWNAHQHDAERRPRSARRGRRLRPARRRREPSA